MNWLVLISAVLQAAPSELALVKQIIDLVHGQHQQIAAAAPDKKAE